ncbi:hypothetical protein [Acidocella sp.]|uniref:hypothetical protein n=1 Tax=Acidocella sp. TaxID=50710 RepID=UPI00345918C5
MRTARHHKRTGVGATMLQHILREAERRTYRRFSLETGSQDHFLPARSLLCILRLSGLRPVWAVCR